MFKTIVITLIFFSGMFSSFGQNTGGHTIGVTYSAFGKSAIVTSKGLVGGASYSDEKFFTTGINYLYTSNKWFGIESGIEYSQYRYLVWPAPNPAIDRIPVSERLSLFTIPVTARVSFLKYFFVNGGLLLGIEASSASSISDQTGIGTLLGLGGQFDFKTGVSIFVNPYFKAHPLVPLSSSGAMHKLVDDGVRFGVMYRIK